MRRVTLKEGADAEGFRRAVRALVAADAPAEAVAFESGPSLFEAADVGDAPPVPLPRAVADLVADVSRHADPERWSLLYRLIRRVLSGERRLVEDVSDPLVHRLRLMRRSVARDIHKMHAFVRFRRVEGAEPERFVAWFEPEHHILEAVGPFFRDRFGAMEWTILTPRGSIRWDRSRLAYGPPGRREDAPAGDSFEEGWRDYYGAIFNPARVNPDAMRAEMPKKYWRNLPEAATIPALVRNAASRVHAMMENEPAAPSRRAPDKALERLRAPRARPASLAELEALVRAYDPPAGFSKRAVTGEGPLGPALAFVGEQPGDQEDLEGRPFVGPAGRLLARALGEVGIERAECYVTNAVKHFKFTERGKRRIHRKPTLGEVKHYRWWLMEELALVRPRLVVALGGTALAALAGRASPVTGARGPARFEDEATGPLPGFVTVHPSYLLRIPDEAAKAQAWADFVRDLAQAKALAA